MLPSPQAAMSDLPLVLDSADVQRLLPRVSVMNAVSQAYEALGRGEAVQPPQTLTLFPKGDGDFITYLGCLASRGVFGAKLSPYISGEAGGVVTAWSVLMSMETGAPLLLCDAKALTTERTAATTVLALDLLAPRQADVLCVVGAGPVGLAHLRLAKSRRPWRSIRLCSPSGADRPEVAAMRAADPSIQWFSDVAEATQDADVILLCTSSARTVLDPTGLDRVAFVASISTNAPQAHEVPPAVLKDMDVYCDYRPTCPSVAGEMVLASASGDWSVERIRGDLPELLTKRADRPTGERPVLFRTVGLGLADIAIAAAVLDAARNLGGFALSSVVSRV